MSIVISDSQSGEDSYWVQATNKGHIAGGLDISDGGNELGNGTITISAGFETGDEIKLPSLGNTDADYKFSLPWNTSTMRYVGEMAYDGGTTTTEDDRSAAFGHYPSTSFYAVMNLATNALPPNVTITSATWSFTIWLSSAGYNEQIQLHALDSGTNGSQTFTTPTTLLESIENPQTSDNYTTIQFSGAALVNALQNFANDPEGFPGFLMRFAELRNADDVVYAHVAQRDFDPQAFSLFKYTGLSGVLNVTFSASSTFEAQALTIWSGQNTLNWKNTFNTAYYTNTSGNATTFPKTITFRVGNAATNTYSATFNRTIDIQAPRVSNIETDPIIFYKDFTESKITQTTVITDVDTDVNTLEVKIEPYFILEDILELTTTDFDTSFNEGILLVSNTNTTTNYQAALRQVRYKNNATQHTMTERTLSVRMKDINEEWSNTVTRKMQMSAELAPISASEVGTAAGVAAGSQAERGVTDGEMALIAGGIVLFVAIITGILMLLKYKGKI